MNPIPEDTPRDPVFAALIARARDGDLEAFSTIATTYQSDLRIAARVHLGPALRPYLDSLDLVQSVHKSLMIGLRHDKYQIESPRSLLALALTMIRRKVARQWRRHRRQIRTNHESMVDVLATLHSDGARPDSQAALHDLTTRIWDELDPMDRQLLELRLDGYTHLEAAEQLGTTAEALRIRLYRIRKHLEQSKILSDWL